MNKFDIRIFIYGILIAVIYYCCCEILKKILILKKKYPYDCKKSLQVDKAKYCRDCKHLFQDKDKDKLCANPELALESITILKFSESLRKSFGFCKYLNKNNNCKFFKEDKEER